MKAALVSQSQIAEREESGGINEVPRKMSAGTDLLENTAS